MVVPYVAVDTRFCPVAERGPRPAGAHRGYHLKQACAHFLGRGMHWCGRQPGGDRGGALAAQDK